MIHDKNGQYTEEARKVTRKIDSNITKIVNICKSYGFNIAEVLYLINSEVQVRLLRDIILNQKKL